MENFGIISFGARIWPTGTKSFWSESKHRDHINLLENLSQAYLCPSKMNLHNCSIHMPIPNTTGPYGSHVLSKLFNYTKAVLRREKLA